MSLLQDDMSNVQDWGEVLPEGWYHVRVKSVDVQNSTNTPGEKVVKLVMSCQEEPAVGKAITDFPSLQKHALSKLKAYYNAIDYHPGPEGHDPDKLKDAELYVHVDHDVYQGQPRMKVAPWGIRSIMEGKPA